MSNKNLLQAFKKHITLLCLISTLIIPVINNFALSLVHSLVAGDIMYATIADILSVFISALDTLNLFIVFGVLINSIIRFGTKQSSDIIALCFIRIFIVYASYIAIGSIVTTNFEATIKGNLFYCFTNALIDVMLLLGAVMLCSLLRSKHLDNNNTDITIRQIFDRKNPLINVILWVSALISVFLLSGCVINTVTDITTYGADNLNMTEVIYLVSPYLRWIFKTVFGYFVMLGIAKWFDFWWKNLYTALSQNKK